MPVELFVRSEQLQIADAGGSSASVGTIAAQVYPGGLVDLYIDSEDSTSGRLLVRLPGHATMIRWPIGARVSISVKCSSAVAFPAKVPRSRCRPASYGVIDDAAAQFVARCRLRGPPRLIGGEQPGDRFIRDRSRVFW